MFNIGGGELVVIALIALIVLGPERLPGAARQIGKTMGDLRRLSSGFQDELRGALDADSASPPTPRRDVLGSVRGEAPDTEDAAPGAAGGGPSKPSPRRRAPLVAGPKANGRQPAGAKAAAKRTGAKSAGPAHASTRSPAKKRAGSPSRRRGS